MRTAKMLIALAACSVWLAPSVQAEQRGHAGGGGGRSGGASPSRGQNGPPQPQGRSGAETGPASATETPAGPFISRLGMAPRGGSPSKSLFFGRGRGVGLPWFDPLWWSEVPPGYEVPQDPDELSGARGSPPSPP